MHKRSLPLRVSSYANCDIKHFQRQFCCHQFQTFKHFNRAECPSVSGPARDNWWRSTSHSETVLLALKQTQYIYGWYKWTWTIYVNFLCKLHSVPKMLPWFESNSRLFLLSNVDYSMNSIHMVFLSVPKTLSKMLPCQWSSHVSRSTPTKRQLWKLLPPLLNHSTQVVLINQSRYLKDPYQSAKFIICPPFSFH